MGKDKIQAPLKVPAWELHFASLNLGRGGGGGGWFLGELIFPGYELLASQSPYYSLFCGQLL